MARTELTVPSAYTPDGVKANYDANIAASNDNFEELYGVETQTITTSPAGGAIITMPIVILDYATPGTDKVVMLPAVANTTLRRVNITKVCADTSTATITARTNEYLDGVQNGTLAMTALGLSVTFQVIDGKWVSDWVGKSAAAPDGQNLVFAPGGSTNNTVFYTNIADGTGCVEILDTGTHESDEIPSTGLWANQLQMGLGSSYVYAKMAGTSNGLFKIWSGSSGVAGFKGDADFDVTLETDATCFLKLRTGTYEADLSADSSGRLVSASGFSGDGSALTGIVDGALSSNVPLLNAANAFTSTNTFQPGAAYDTATLGAEILDATTWTLNSGWTYVSGTDWTQGFVHSGAITAVNATPTNGGTGYTLNDVLTVTTGDGTATVTATGVTDGVVTAVTLTSGGTTGYRGGAGQATSGGTGNGCTVNVTAIAGGTGTLTHSDNASAGYKQVTVTITGRTAGWITVTYGLTTFPATATSTAWGFSPSAGPLSIAPSTNFDGAVTVSVKAITPSAATFTIKDSSGTATLEGRSQTASLGNQYLGVSSGRYNTTGVYNTGYGNLSLSNVTSGVNNTASGYRSLATLTYGSNNCAYGSYAGYVVTIGSGNSLFGQYSGAVLTTGSDNNGFGTRSLFGCVTGSYNVGIGTYTGNVATGSGNIFLGYSAGRYATGSNEFYVNNKDQTNTEKEKANSLLYGVMGATAAAQTLQVGGKLKVDPTNPVGGYTAPTEALDVVGNIKASGGVTANTFPLIQWRGSSASDPTENLSEGQMYWNTSGSLKIYTGSAWVIVGIGP